MLGVREDQVRKELLQKRKLSLDEAVDHCRSCEASSRAMRLITEKKETIHKVESKKQKKQRGKVCYFCGGIHDWKKRKECPAYGKKCKKCGRDNHFESVCGKVPWMKKNKQSVHSVEGIDDSDSETEDTEYLYSVSMTGMKNANKRDIHSEMMIKGQAEPTKFQVDCGATTNLISRSLVPEAEIRPNKQNSVHVESVQGEASG